MSFAAYISGMVIISLICWGAFGVAVFSINPYTADFTSMASFFVSLFFALTGTITSLMFYIRGKIMDDENLTKEFIISFRHAALISIGLVGLSVLQAFRILNWWDGILMFGAVLLLEFYFRSRKI